MEEGGPLHTHTHYEGAQAQAAESQGDQAISSALHNADEMAQKTFPSPKANRVARTICKKAFALFEEKLHEKYPSEDNLIALVTESRTNLFFLELKERVLSVIQPPNPEAPSEGEKAPSSP